MYGNFQQQMQEQVTLHQVKLALDSFYNILEPLEEFIEKANYYPNFRSRRQFYRRVIQSSEGSVENAKNLFLTDLYIFSGAVEGEVGFIMDVLKEDFYRWINYVEITARNCPERLKHYLIEINNVLEGNDKKIVRETDERDRVRAKKTDLTQIIPIFSGLQQPLNRNREQRKELGNIPWNKLDDKDRVKGNADLGKKTFKEIERSISIPHQSFQLWQKMKEEEINVNNSQQIQTNQEQLTVEPPQGRWQWVNGGWLWIPNEQSSSAQFNQQSYQQRQLFTTTPSSNNDNFPKSLIFGGLVLVSLIIGAFIYKFRKNKFRFYFKK